MKKKCVHDIEGPCEHCADYNKRVNFSTKKIDAAEELAKETNVLIAWLKGLKLVSETSKPSVDKLARLTRIIQDKE